MNRAEFIKSCAYACLSGVAVTAILQSCKSTKHLETPITGSDLVLSEKEFEYTKKGALSYHKYIIVQNELLKFPICLYRLESGYKAFYLECTHQGAELQVYGEKVVCPAHGSEFNQQGGVESGPATDSLRMFPVSVGQGEIKISLKA